MLHFCLKIYWYRYQRFKRLIKFDNKKYKQKSLHNNFCKEKFSLRRVPNPLSKWFVISDIKVRRRAQNSPSNKLGTGKTIVGVTLTENRVGHNRSLLVFFVLCETKAVPPEYRCVPNAQTNSVNCFKLFPNVLTAHFAVHIPTSYPWLNLNGSSVTRKVFN